jgi:hypothetical protein
MQIKSNAFADQQTIPENNCFGVRSATDHVALGQNRNPDVQWSGVPEGTQSLVLICVDSDVPTKPDDVNKEGRSVPADLPRANFYHWVLVDIPPETSSIAEGACSDGITPRGKQQPAGPAGSRQGVNDYTGWFAGDAEMAGTYRGYDGPCPPWNDELVHHYHFILYATDLERCPVDGDFTGPDVESAIDGHVLAETRITGTYSLNPAVSG